MYYPWKQSSCMLVVRLGACIDVCKIVFVVVVAAANKSQDFVMFFYQGVVQITALRDVPECSFYISQMSTSVLAFQQSSSVFKLCLRDQNYRTNSFCVFKIQVKEAINLFLRKANVAARFPQSQLFVLRGRHHLL